MPITVIAVVAILLFAFMGFIRGLYKIAAAFVALFLAAVLAKPAAPLLAWLLVKSDKVPQSLVPLAGLVLAGLLLFLLFDFAAGLFLRKREAARKRMMEPRIPRWERVGGAVLGTAWGFFLVVFVLIGIHLIGNVEEVMAMPIQPAAARADKAAALPPARAGQPSASLETADSLKAGKPAEGPFAKLKSQIERSAFGTMVRKTDTVGDKLRGIFLDLRIVMGTPSLYDDFNRHPVIARFTKDPRMLAVAEDRQIQDQLQKGQYYDLLYNPKIADLLKDDELFRELRHVDLGKILAEVIAKKTDDASRALPISSGIPCRKCLNCVGSDGKYRDAFTSGKEALQQAALIRTESGRALQAYECPFGNGWHLKRE